MTRASWGLVFMRFRYIPQAGPMVTRCDESAQFGGFWSFQVLRLQPKGFPGLGALVAGLRGTREDVLDFRVLGGGRFRVHFELMLPIAEVQNFTTHSWGRTGFKGSTLIT